MQASMAKPRRTMGKLASQHRMVAAVLFLSAVLLLHGSNQNLDPVKRDLLLSFSGDGADAASDQQQDSSHATVMGMAMARDIFVGSLRATGFKGNIILAISQDPKEGVEAYLKSQNVTLKRINVINCTYDILTIKGVNKNKLNSHTREVGTCAHPYPDLKIRWSRFALLRDYLEECDKCTGPVLVTDVRDTFFQRDPFGPEAPPVAGLQVFEEHKSQRTTHWLTQFPIEQCKKIPIFNETMLCSGTTIGTRQSMLRYLHDMLFYTGKMPYATAQPNRMGLVHTAGKMGGIISKALNNNKHEDKNRNTSPTEESRGDWLGTEYDLTDRQGFFINSDGQRSFAVHQADRFGPRFDYWLWHDGPLKGL
ncbi:expressed unknown protein [Seminavis robusta]|uniref:Uncharacterized protein n=1 Tax=Seminavis robusta TaxID=568900 RepID=A0A9N8DA41_9STRA|nr:expressed unknown protein [Seminavis robusta]|eukprot:Sro48_g028130.1 n/a (365) ;mRNA; r:36347-37646